MNNDQVILFVILLVFFGMLIWGKIRYDLVAFSALVIAVIAGVIPESKAFDGFAHHATIIIALVLILSKALSKSGAIELIARQIIDSGRKLSTHIAIMCSVSAILSAIMNNVAALALLMPIDIHAAAKAKRNPALTLKYQSMDCISSFISTHFCDELYIMRNCINQGLRVLKKQSHFLVEMDS